VLAGLRDALIAAPGDADAVQLFGIASACRRQLAPASRTVSRVSRVRLGHYWRLHVELGRSATSGPTMVFGVAGREGIVPVVVRELSNGARAVLGRRQNRGRHTDLRPRT